MSNKVPSMFNRFEKKLYECQTLATFPKPTFLESIALDDQGNLYVTSLDEGAVYQIKLNGDCRKYVSTPGKLAGIVQLTSNTFLCNGWNEVGTPTIYKLTSERQFTTLAQPDGAMFLNGMTKLTNDIVLICDAYKGVIWKYEISTNIVSVWFDDPLLKRLDNSDPMPAANGIKLLNDALFVSNTAQRLLLKISLTDNEPTTIEIFLDKVNLDDFAISSEGTIYATTHIYNSVIAISKNKEVLIIADEKDGATGSTAAIFGNTTADRNYIYVTTNGGISLAPDSGLEDGKVIKIKVK